jgi:hypothetical protein
MTKKTSSIYLTSGSKRPNYSLISKNSSRFKKLFDSAMYFIHYEYDNKRLKSETIKYAKSHKLDTTTLNKLDNYHFSIVGKPCVIINNGGCVPCNWKEHIDCELKRLSDIKIEENDDDIEKKNTPNVHDYIKEKARTVCGMLEEWVDQYVENPSSFKKKKLDALTLLRTEDVKPTHARLISKMFSINVEEMKAVIEGSDKDLVEAYGHLTKTQKKYMLEMYLSFINAAETISKETPTRRKKKPVSADKLVSKLKYLNEYPDLNLVSIPPVDIIGAKILWVYNTKTRKLGRYVSIDDVGLSVKGTTIVGFSESESIEKTIRKPVEKMKEFMKAKPNTLKTFIENLTTVDIKMTGRINEHCILLKTQ